MIENDLTIRIGGEAGMGLESSGVGFCRALTRGGHHVIGVPDFYSRIRGGHNFFTIRVAQEPVYALADGVHLLLALDLETVRRHVDDMVEGGAVVYDSRDELPEELTRPDVNFFAVPLRADADRIGGQPIMRNTLSLGIAARLLGFDASYNESVIRDNFITKGEDVVNANLKVNAAGVRAAEVFAADFPFTLGDADDGGSDRICLNGSEAFAMGALAGGCRFSSGYPMTPGSPVLQWFAVHADAFGAVTKHAEDEIAAINMALGASLMGARALVPTSGGGFSLMVEATGLAGITETPVVIYNAQRPGPATGMPTRTEQGDLLFMIYASQGEFPRFVLAPGYHEECFDVGWKCFNMADRWQTPVMVLSDQFLADSFRTVERSALDFDAVEIDRGELLADEDLDALEGEYLRYRVTESGVSPRALPGHPHAVWVTAGNEHAEDSSISEDPANRVEQNNKRLRKTVGMRKEVPPPELYGPEDAPLTLVCWGSTYGPVREAVDVINHGGDGRANMVHFSGLEPFPPDAEALLADAENFIAVEMNATGQLETLIRARTGMEVDGAIRKYDGRPMRPSYVLQYLSEEV
jgi:2-oxoglutarate ferredoxin oxidoreductase subunit alpha